MVCPGEDSMHNKVDAKGIKEELEFEEAKMSWKKAEAKEAVAEAVAEGKEAVAEAKADAKEAVKDAKADAKAVEKGDEPAADSEEGTVGWTNNKWRAKPQRV
jgi:predicted RNA-binding protein with PUA domain